MAFGLHRQQPSRINLQGLGQQAGVLLPYGTLAVFHLGNVPAWYARGVGKGGLGHALPIPCPGQEYAGQFRVYVGQHFPSGLGRPLLGLKAKAPQKVHGLAAGPVKQSSTASVWGFFVRACINNHLPGHILPHGNVGRLAFLEAAVMPVAGQAGIVGPVAAHRAAGLHGRDDKRQGFLNLGQGGVHRRLSAWARRWRTKEKRFSPMPQRTI